MTESQIEDFKDEIKKVLLLLPKYTNLKDFTKKFREETGQSINQRLVQVHMQLNNSKCLLIKLFQHPAELYQTLRLSSIQMQRFYGCLPL